MFKLKPKGFVNIKINNLYKKDKFKEIIKSEIKEEEVIEISLCKICGITNEYIQDKDYICWSCKSF